MKKSHESRKPTEAQIDANRRNAQKSTGPRTPEGRAASSRNRLVHGLRANKHILLDEDPEEFLILLKDLHDRFRPAGDGEEELVMRIASAQWRLHRTLPMEAGIYRERLQSVAAVDYRLKRELVNHKRNHQLNPEHVADERFFEQVFIDYGAVAWPGEIDLAPDAMYAQLASQRDELQQAGRQEIAADRQPACRFLIRPNRIANGPRGSVNNVWRACRHNRKRRHSIRGRDAACGQAFPVC